MHLRALGLLLSLVFATACSSKSEESDGPTEPTGDGIAIVTTREIRDHSKLLGEFVEQKRQRDFRAVVVTEDDYGSDGKLGVARARAIRTWLQSVQSDYRYVILIGDGHPVYGDVPMWTVWPRHLAAADNCLGAFPIDCRTCETDMLYGNLDGDWDLNGDGHPGQHELDDGPGGIDFETPLLVGRIPVYFGDANEADSILEHALAYMNEPASALAYRKKVLLAGTQFYFKGQRLESSVVSTTVDGAEVTEFFSKEAASSHADLSFTRLYERDGHEPSLLQGEVPVTEDAFANTWNEGYGVVFWAGHGLPTHVARTVWTADSDGDGSADSSELTSPTLISSSTTERLTGKQSAFVMALSCEVGSADVPYNLSQAALLSGAAIGMVGSSSVTPGDPTDYEHAKTFDTAEFGGTNGGIAFMERVLNGETGASALAAAKLELGTSKSSETYAARMMLNYFGDPTLTLSSSVADIEKD